MVTGTSAIVAILFEESDAQLYAQAIQGAAIRLMYVVTRVELAIVVEGRKREAGREGLERFLAVAGVEVVATSPMHAKVTIDAIRPV